MTYVNNTPYELLPPSMTDLVYDRKRRRYAEDKLSKTFWPPFDPHLETPKYIAAKGGRPVRDATVSPCKISCQSAAPSQRYLFPETNCTITANLISSHSVWQIIKDCTRAVYYNVEATQRHIASRGLSATVEQLVSYVSVLMCGRSVLSVRDGHVLCTTGEHDVCHESTQTCNWRTFLSSAAMGMFYVGYSLYQPSFAKVLR